VVGSILDEPELHLARDVVVPDLAGWRRERMPQLPTDKAYFDAPDWACEVLSPSTATIDCGVKREVYTKHAVPHIWLVDPEAKTLDAGARRRDVSHCRCARRGGTRARAAV
jgi:Uma2 family endonuclease